MEQEKSLFGLIKFISGNVAHVANIATAEDLWLVAKNYGVTIGSIIKLNREEDIKDIRTGERIRIM